MSGKQWMVQFRSCDPWWADANQHIKDYRLVEVPWKAELTERIDDDEEQARDQYNTLSQWETSGTQPVKEVRLFVREPSEWKEIS